MSREEAERANVYPFFPTARQVPMHFHYQHLHLHHQQLLQYHQQQLLRQQLLHHHCNEDGYCDFQQPPPPDFLQPRIFHPIPVYNEYVVHHPIMCDMRDEMVEFQKLSNEYEPDLQSLAQTHSHYRIMKGDGNSVAFGYFENLFALQDEAKVVQELARIKSFNRMFDAVGQQEHLYEIFVDATEELLNHMIEHIAGDNPDDMFILETFNDEWNSNAIITHFRLMTSAWMQLNSERYEAFLSVPIEQYCSRTIDTVRTEIDEIGLQALVDGVIEASGFDVQILYLDRSQGDEVNAHQLTSQRNGSLGTIKLLYRPSGSPTPVNCHLPLDQASEPQDHSAYEYEYLYPIHPEHPPAEMIPHHTVPLPEPIQPEVATINLPPRPPPTEDRSSELLIRMNPLVDPDMNCLPLTIPFRNSHFNQAHFQNSEFQPSQWDPSEINKREKKPSSRSGSSSE
ncbi:conserved hypothetical protein [Microsporum canis CBS 113480]|uniref:ubiquitinyl hydrolase 1 n=1 Tax=Arthroderma otae (strain ATCC MYA-4605 / CBS 113480) TaxID=554155 RepID=C5FZK9_ARTOC|nr:conserved hypothetical protein [Microsporum canis CBS 113480]EEQ35312.1 conserved hypothetical protein [Microsporum canis CBS 113480]